tara:strand:- start:638 stop:787 length:150 start_codon:yes stop_codon:yes gene_type:complete
MHQLLEIQYVKYIIFCGFLLISLCCCYHKYKPVRNIPLVEEIEEIEEII